MCGRYSFAPTPKQQAELPLPVPGSAILSARYNIAPTQRACVITHRGAAAVQTMEWGLVPHWSKDGKNSGALINARAESLLEKPSFRDAFRNRRCLVPADSFYEWKTLPGRQKAPYRIHSTDGQLLFMAGIWDIWQHNGEEKTTFSIVTTAPNREMSEIHNRMPLLLTTAEARERWLAEPNEVLLQPAPDHLLTMYRVTTKLNATTYDAPDAHERELEEWTLF
jgi:putative SOS response-associated peptidase YedK